MLAALDFAAAALEAAGVDPEAILSSRATAALAGAVAAWDAGRPAHRTGVGLPDASAAAPASAAPARSLRQLGRLLKAARKELLVDEPRQDFYLMLHSGFVETVRWAGDLVEEDKRLLLRQTGRDRYRVVTFGVADNVTARLREEFAVGVPAEFGYTFLQSDAYVISFHDKDGSDLSGRAIETPLKALLKAAKKRHAHGEALLLALGCIGIQPFDHPACAVPGAAPNGIKDETMLVHPEVWMDLISCKSTKELAAYFQSLMPTLDSSVDIAAFVFPGDV